MPPFNVFPGTPSSQIQNRWDLEPSEAGNSQPCVTLANELAPRCTSSHSFDGLLQSVWARPKRLSFAKASHRFSAQATQALSAGTPLGMCSRRRCVSLSPHYNAKTCCKQGPERDFLCGPSGRINWAAGLSPSLVPEQTFLRRYNSSSNSSTAVPITRIRRTTPRLTSRQGLP